MKDKERLSLDTKDFDLTFAKGLSLKDGAATITEVTVRLIATSFLSLLGTVKDKLWKIVVCGGGRKNKFLMKRLRENVYKNIILQPIDDYGVDGDFIESQAFAYLAIRSYLNLPISFPKTTGVSKPCSGGEIIEN